MYHVQCFVCSVCKKELAAGEQLFLIQVCAYTSMEDVHVCVEHELLHCFESKPFTYVHVAQLEEYMYVWLISHRNQ